MIDPDHIEKNHLLPWGFSQKLKLRRISGHLASYYTWLFSLLFLWQWYRLFQCFWIWLCLHNLSWSTWWVVAYMFETLEKCQTCYTWIQTIVHLHPIQECSKHWVKNSNCWSKDALTYSLELYTFVIMIKRAIVIFSNHTWVWNHHLG